jgi:uncharacterized protein
VLIIQLDEIKETGLFLEGNLNPEELPQLRELADDGFSRFVEPVQYRVNISRIVDMVEVRGEVESVVDLSCGRCLERYTLPFATSFSIAFARQLPACVDDDGEEIELSAEELGLTLLEGDELSLSEPLQEQVLMALPIKPLCRQDCKGICAHCGASLNSEKCSCEEPAFDTRFASLKNFKVQK